MTDAPSPHPASQSPRAPSVLTYGEALLKLVLPPAERLETLSHLEAQCAGSELNVAAALAALGTNAAWGSALPAGPLGAWARRHIRLTGVQDLALEKPGRLGSFYLEDHYAPRHSRVVYDRTGSAFTTLTADDFNPAWLAWRTALHISGISLALGSGPRELALKLLGAAKDIGLTISFDVNHRRLLLSEKEAQKAYMPALWMADLIFVAERDVGIFGGIQAIRALNPAALIIQTHGAAGSEAHTPDGQTFIQPAIATGGPGRVGRGDAFAAAFLHAYLRGENPAEALAFAAAAAALKTTTPGDQLQASENEVQAVQGAARSLGEPIR